LWRQLEAIKAFGAGRPSQYGLCQPSEDLSLMTGFEAVRGDMAAWEAYLSDKELKKARRHPKRK
jgi:hypothetical protein